jgi:hypothetical protein
LNEIQKIIAFVVLFMAVVEALAIIYMFGLTMKLVWPGITLAFGAFVIYLARKVPDMPENGKVVGGIQASTE